jgi:hypothetical protein
MVLVLETHGMKVVVEANVLGHIDHKPFRCGYIVRGAALPLANGRPPIFLFFLFPKFFQSEPGPSPPLHEPKSNTLQDVLKIMYVREGGGLLQVNCQR